MDTKFKGKGTKSMKGFVADSVTLFNALLNTEVKMPSNFAGEGPTIELIEEGDNSKLELDMNDAIVFNPDFVTMRLDGATLDPSEFDVSVVNGQLRIRHDV